MIGSHTGGYHLATDTGDVDDANLPGSRGKRVWLSILLAVAAAVANAVASVLQRKGARDEPDERAFGLSLLWDLVHRPAWLGGVVAIIIGFLSQAAALANGPIALVQPILILELGFTLMLSGAVFRTSLHTREWVAVVGMSVGIALLLFALNPTGGDTRHAPLVGWLLGSAVTIAAMVVFVVAGRHRRDASRAGYLGLAAGICFGYTAALLAGVASAFANGMAAVFGAWQTYVLIMVGPLGFFLLQNALQAGRLVASQPALTLANPLTALGWGVAVFGEHVRGGGWFVGDLIGATLIGSCTVLLTRSPLIGDRE